MNKLLLAFGLLCLPLTALAQAPAPAATDSAQPAVVPGPAGITRESAENPLVEIQTSMGSMILELFPQEAPETVANFLGLAEGTKPFIDPITQQQVTRPFYDGLIFHRVIDGFMIQGGSPTGQGDGGPGYTFPDEINAASLGLDQLQVIQDDGYPHPFLGVQTQRDFQEAVLMPLYAKMGIASQEELDGRLEEVDETVRDLTVKEAYENQGYRYSDAVMSRAPIRGVIAMANAGPNTNGSQFFINLADTPWLTGRHTVFGKVRAGLDVLDAIGKVRVDDQNRPLQEVRILTIRRVDG